MRCTTQSILGAVPVDILQLENGNRGKNPLQYFSWHLKGRYTRTAHINTKSRPHPLNHITNHSCPFFSHTYFYLLLPLGVKSIIKQHQRLLWTNLEGRHEVCLCSRLVSRNGGWYRSSPGSTLFPKLLSLLIWAKPKLETTRVGWQETLRMYVNRLTQLQTAKGTTKPTEMNPVIQKDGGTWYGRTLLSSNDRSLDIGM